MFRSPNCEKVLKVRKNLIFMGVFFSKKPFFCSGTSQKAPQGPIGTPQDDRNYLFELPGYENPILGKRIFDLSPIKKSWLVQTMRLGTPYWIFRLPKCPLGAIFDPPKF